MAVIAKIDCRVFCHILSLEDKISNTAAPIKPNPFWFWEKYQSFSCIFRELLVFFPVNVLKSKSVKETVRNAHIYIQLMKQHMTENEHITSYLLKTIFPQNHTSNFWIFAPVGSRAES